MKNFSIPPFVGRPLSARGYAPRASLAAAASLLCFVAVAPAQNLPTPSVPGAGAVSAPIPAPQPLAPNINVLILALDDLSAPPAPTPLIPAAPTLPAPIAPADGAEGAIATPASAHILIPHWFVSAKKTKEEKRREREAEDAKIFNTDPVPMTVYPKPKTAPGTVVTPPRTNPITPPINDGALPGNPAVPLVPALSVAAPGRSQLMALAVRRTLMAKGYADVQVATPESGVLVRAIGEQRLSTRVLDELKRALSTLATASDASALIVAGRAASRIGQATGYRAVVAFYAGVPAPIQVVGAGTAVGETTEKVAVNMVVADAQRESVEPLQFAAVGADENVWRETGGASGASLLDQTLRDWPATSSADREKMAQIHFNAAKAALDRGDLARAQDELNQSLSLDSSRAQSYVLRGDILKSTDPAAAAVAYRRATALDATDGLTWAKIASAYAYAKTPDWPAALEAGRKALALNYDGAALRVAMATAQYGRADLFRKADYPGKADEAEAEARVHLERALQLAPDDPSAVRLLANSLVNSRRYAEAALTLDRIAPRYPKDVEIQTQYAQALSNQAGREEDAFAAYGRVWKLTNQKAVVVDASVYRALSNGFDQRLYNLGKVATQLSNSVGTGAIPRETALLQLTKLKEEMDAAQDTINIMKPSTAIGATAVTARIFAADLMDQSLQLFQNYLETGQDGYRVNGLDLYRQAVTQLNTARSTS